MDISGVGSILNRAAPDALVSSPCNGNQIFLFSVPLWLDLSLSLLLAIVNFITLAIFAGWRQIVDATVMLLAMLALEEAMACVLSFCLRMEIIDSQSLLNLALAMSILFLCLPCLLVLFHFLKPFRNVGTVLCASLTATAATFFCIISGFYFLPSDLRITPMVLQALTIYSGMFMITIGVALLVVGKRGRTDVEKSVVVIALTFGPLSLLTGIANYLLKIFVASGSAHPGLYTLVALIQLFNSKRSVICLPLYMIFMPDFRAAANHVFTCKCWSWRTRHRPTVDIQISSRIGEKQVATENDIRPEYSSNRNQKQI